MGGLWRSTWRNFWDITIKFAGVNAHSRHVFGRDWMMTGLTGMLLSPGKSSTSLVEYINCLLIEWLCLVVHEDCSINHPVQPEPASKSSTDQTGITTSSCLQRAQSPSLLHKTQSRVCCTMLSGAHSLHRAQPGASSSPWVRSSQGILRIQSLL